MPYSRPPLVPHTQPYVAACPGCGRDALWLCRRVPHSGNDGAALEVRCSCGEGQR